VAVFSAVHLFERHEYPRALFNPNGGIDVYPKPIARPDCGCPQ